MPNRDFPIWDALNQAKSLLRHNWLTLRDNHLHGCWGVGCNSNEDETKLFYIRFVKRKVNETYTKKSGENQEK